MYVLFLAVGICSASNTKSFPVDVIKIVLNNTTIAAFRLTAFAKNESMQAKFM